MLAMPQISALAAMTMLHAAVISDAAAASASTRLVHKDAGAAYKDFKEILASEKVSAFGTADVESFRLPEQVTIAPCAGGDFYADFAEETSDPLSAKLMNLAIVYSFAELALRTGKYPEKLWLQELQKAEKSAVRLQARRPDQLPPDGLENVAKAVNRGLANAKLNLPRVNPFAECDVEFQSFTMKILPRQAKVRLIPKIFYLFCKRNHIDPLDRNACDYWRSPIKDGQQINLAGIYLYTVEESGTRTSPDEVDVDPYASSGVLELPR